MFCRFAPVYFIVLAKIIVKFNAPQLAKYARPAAQKGCASYAKGLAPPFRATMCNYPTYFSVDPQKAINS